ncbi:MAG: fmt [Burkholderiaceae bacterium]|nr:fmt [Burkholderiaceae bacterium]
MKVVFAGTPEFAAQALAAIIAAGFNVPLVLTQPDRPSGRGMKLTPSAVKQIALQHSIPVAQPISLRLNGKYPDQAEEARARLVAAQADVMVVAAYGLILPEDALNLPKHGCINIHASLLPRWRGAAPIHRAIEAGDAQTGITLMQMDAGLDTGDMLAVETMPILPTHTTALLHDELAQIGARMVVNYLQQLQAGQAPKPVPQPTDGITYAEKISKAESKIDWHQSAEVLARKIRALNPAPVCVSEWQQQPLKIWAAQALLTPHASAVGTILAINQSGVHVACGQGVLCITEMQKAGGKRGLATQVADSLKMSAHSQFATH